METSTSLADADPESLFEDPESSDLLFHDSTLGATPQIDHTRQPEKFISDQSGSDSEHDVHNSFRNRRDQSIQETHSSQDSEPNHSYSEERERIISTRSELPVLFRPISTPKKALQIRKRHADWEAETRNEPTTKRRRSSSISSRLGHYNSGGGNENSPISILSDDKEEVSSAEENFSERQESSIHTTMNIASTSEIRSEEVEGIDISLKNKSTSTYIVHKNRALFESNEEAQSLAKTKSVIKKTVKISQFENDNRSRGEQYHSENDSSLYSKAAHRGENRETFASEIESTSEQNRDSDDDSDSADEYYETVPAFPESGANPNSQSSLTFGDAASEGSNVGESNAVSGNNNEDGLENGTSYDAVLQAAYSSQIPIQEDPDSILDSGPAFDSDSDFSSDVEVTTAPGSPLPESGLVVPDSEKEAVSPPEPSKKTPSITIEDLFSKKEIYKEAETESQTRTKQVWFWCKKCPYQNRHKKTLVTHCKGHVEKNRHKCRYCSWTSGRTDYLHKHMSLHPEYKESQLAKQLGSQLKNASTESTKDPLPYPCERGCGKTFRRKDHAKRHSERHIKDVFCKFCKKFRDTEQSYNLHVKECAEKTKWKCEECGMVFRFQKQLHEHMREKHPTATCKICCRSMRRGWIEKHLSNHGIKMRNESSGEITNQEKEKAYHCESHGPAQKNGTQLLLTDGSTVGKDSDNQSEDSGSDDPVSEDEH